MFIHRCVFCMFLCFFPIETIFSENLTSITLRVDTTLSSLKNEGYFLAINNDTAAITAKTSTGVFYGIQTLRQILPTDIEKRQKVNDVLWTMPQITILDTARFPWRGSLLDCSRHFFNKDQVKRFIDLLAFHKMNRFHWHLTDDQGWRIEIKKYPMLTQIGAWRDGGAYGGFYTQEEVKEIVAYAEQRGVITIPEIEMPGHAMSALAAYPNLSCTGGPFQVTSGWGVFQDVYCAGNDSVFIFLQDVLTEIVDLFPSNVIHIGGDECPKDRWNACSKCKARMSAENLTDAEQLQSWFIKKIQTFLKTKGRDIIGWDEILQGGLAPGAKVQSWQGMSGGIAAANAGSDVVMSPTSHCYFNIDYSNISLNKAYTFEPVPSVIASDKVQYILGTEGNLWSEYIADQYQLDYQAYPRICALAEVGWTPETVKNWSGFSLRLSRHYTRLSNIGVNFYRDPSIPPDTSTISALIIPQPVQVQLQSNETVLLDSSTIIHVTDSTQFAGNYFASLVLPSTGFKLMVKKSPNESSTSNGLRNFQPVDFTLSAFPNPFNPNVNIRVNCCRDGTELKILNVNGKVVADLTSALKSGVNRAMSQQVVWNATDHASGVYLMLLRQGKVELKRKVMLIK